MWRTCLGWLTAFLLVLGCAASAGLPTAHAQAPRAGKSPPTESPAKRPQPAAKKRPESAPTEETPPRRTATAARQDGSKQPPTVVQYLIALGALVLVLVVVCVPTRETD